VFQVARTVIVTRADLDGRYPDVELGGFEPTHHVRVMSSRGDVVVRDDYVRLNQGDEDVRYAFVPGEDEPVYAVLSTGLWQCLAVHGRVCVQEVRYKVEHIPQWQVPGLVYFVQSGSDGPIKIGWSRDVSRRVAELQTANAHVLVLLGTVAGTMEDEAAFHARFAHLRMEAEWFCNSPEIHAFLRDSR
jgi:hypothetical protein